MDITLGWSKEKLPIAAKYPFLLCRPEETFLNDNPTPSSISLSKNAAMVEGLPLAKSKMMKIVVTVLLQRQN